MTRPTNKVFISCAVLLGGAVLASSLSFRLPGNDEGYEPVQPLAYSHRLHAGELGIDCQYCHFGAALSPVAGIPPASLCMNCHATVTAAKDAVETERFDAEREKREPRPIVSPELRKLYDALALDAERKPIVGGMPSPIRWVRVHDLPDFVVFDHRVHVARSIECQTCHGPVETMDRVRQVPTLSMGWCVECHRINARDGHGAIPPGLGHPRVDSPVTTDCAVCHY